MRRNLELITSGDGTDAGYGRQLQDLNLTIRLTTLANDGCDPPPFGVIDTRIRHQEVFSPHMADTSWVVVEWHQAKLQSTAVSLLCAPLGTVGVAESALGPAREGVGSGPFRSRRRKAGRGTNLSNCA